MVKYVRANSYPKFTPQSTPVSGNRGMSERQIDDARRKLPEHFTDMSDKELQLWYELQLRGMVMSCLIYGGDIHKNIKTANIFDDYYHQPYVNEYYDLLGVDVTEQVIDAQTEYFNRGKVIHNVGTDSEGVSYNSYIEPEDY